MRSLARMVTLAAHRFRQPHVHRLTQELSRRQWLSTSELLTVGEERARALAIHAYRNVPYYRGLFRNLGIVPTEMSFPSDWQRIPVLQKDTLRSQPDSLTSTTHHAKRAIDNASGGSTGKPVTFLSDLLMFDIMAAFSNIVLSWAGWKPGDMCFHLWGGGKEARTKGSIGHLKNLVAGRVIFPVYSYQEEDFILWWKQMGEYKPTVIYAYPSVAAAFAAWLRDRGYKPIGVKGVICSAEMLLPSDRDVIQESFGCTVLNQYGSRETPAVACECPLGNMHVFVDLNKVEFVDEGDAGCVKTKIVVTPLFNYAQPLIRYDTDDYGSPMSGSCSCGRGYPIMNMQIGRRNDHLIALDGRMIFPSFFIHLLDGKTWIGKYQFQQSRPSSVDLIIESAASVENDGKIGSLQRELLPRLKATMGDDISLTVKRVDSIARTRAGKHRYVINRLTERYK